MKPSFEHFRVEAWLSDNGDTLNISAHYGTEQPIAERSVVTIPTSEPAAKEALKGFSALGQLFLGVGEEGWSFNGSTNELTANDNEDTPAQTTENEDEASETKDVAVQPQPETVS